MTHKLTKTTLCERLCTLYQTSLASARWGKRTRHDWKVVEATLEKQLHLGLDFAICFTESRAVSTMLDTAHIRYICEGGSGCDFPNALGGKGSGTLDKVN